MLLRPDQLNFDDELPTIGTLGRNISRRADITLDSDFLVTESQLEVGRGTQTQRAEADDDLQLEDDLGLDIGDDIMEEDPSVEVGRDAPAPRDVADDLLSMRDDGETTLKLGMDESEIGRGGYGDGGVGMDIDIGNDFMLPQDDGFFPGRADSDRDLTPIPLGLPETDSPLSSVRSSMERELAAEIERPHRDLDVSDFDPLRLPSEEVEAPTPRAIKKRKLTVDEEIEIKNRQFKAQQEDRSRILREPNLLPRDPTLLSLLAMQQTGGFARSIFYPTNVNPNIAKLLSPDFIKEMAERKRKRALDEEAPDAGAGSPSDIRLDTHDDDDLLPGNVTSIRAGTTRGDDDQFMIPGGDDFEYAAQPLDDSGIAGGFSPPRRGASLSPVRESLPPAEIVSQATTHAVHLLRERFNEPETQSELTKESIVFSDMFPENATTRADATKMFFEVLVLATKDAVSVKQQKRKNAIGGKIEIKGKKALWGMWAETGDTEKEGEMGGALVGVAPATAESQV